MAFDFALNSPLLVLRRFVNISRLKRKDPAGCDLGEAVSSKRNDSFFEINVSQETVFKRQVTRENRPRRRQGRAGDANGRNRLVAWRPG